MKILVATDGSVFGKAAVETAAKQIWQRGSEVRIISVVDPPVAIGGEIYMMNMNLYAQAEKIARAQAQKTLEESESEISKGINGDNVNVSTSVLMGAPNRRIVEEAEEWDADLIILGSHGYRMWERILLGSVSHSVAQHAKCSVWIVRSKSEKK